MNREEARGEIERILDLLLASYDRLIRREIDASACGTRHDWNRLHEAQDAYYEAREAAIGDILKLVK